MNKDEERLIIKKNRRYLESYLELKRDFLREKDEANFWRAVAYNVSASKLDESGVTKTSYSNFSPIDKYLEVSERCEERAEQIDKKRKEIVAAIDSLEASKQREVLKLHYIDDYGFYDIANILVLNLDYVYRLHNNGLKSFIIPETD